MQTIFISIPLLLAIVTLACVSFSNIIQVDDAPPATVTKDAQEIFETSASAQAIRPTHHRFSQTRPKLSGPVQTLDTAHFRLHYTLEGDDAVAPADEDGNDHPDYVDEVARTMEHVRQVQLDQLGWAAPPLDGDALYDIYLHNIFNDGTAGYAEGDADTVVGDNPHSPEPEEWAAYSYIGLDNDYAELDEWSDSNVTALDFMRSTAAHEYNHAIQFGYDSEEPAEWLWEATASWMQDEIYNQINDGNEDLYAVFKTPDTCQVAYSRYEVLDEDNHWYGLWIFLRYISENYGHQTVRAIWEQARDHDGYAALDTALAQVGTSSAELLPNFAVALLTRNFAEGADYPLVRLEGVAYPAETFTPTDGVGQMAVDYIEIVADGPVAVTLAADQPENRAYLEGVLVGINGQRAGLIELTNQQAMIDAAAFDQLYLMVINKQQVDAEADCDLTGYTVTVDAAEGGQLPTQTLTVPHFQPPQVEALDSLYDEADEDSGSDEDATDGSPDLLLGYVPPEYTLEDVYQMAAADFEFDEEELLWWVPGNGPATVLDYWGPNDEQYLSVIASDSPYPTLNAWLAAVEYDPDPDELQTIHNIPVFISDLSDDDEIFSNATFILDGQFITIDGTITVEEMIEVVEGFLAK